jgi:putative DNA primase/helicase
VSSQPRIGERCKGRWKALLPQLGIDAKYLDGNHHPCPCSGQGDDRFRFSNKNGRGNFFCACNDGKSDGFKLLECKHGVDFKAAAKMVEEIIGEVAEDGPTQERTREDALRHLRAVQRQVEACGSRDHVERYLAGRGLVAVPPTLRQARINYGLRKIGITEDFDAMVAKVVSADGTPSTMHLTYLRDGQKAAIERDRVVMTPSTPMAGGAVRLMPMRRGELGVAEGIETALSAHALFGVPVWATLNAQMLEAFQPPQGCTLLHIYGDHDENFTGQAAAYALAKRCALKWQVPCRVHIPLRPGDYNDVLVRGA